MDFLSETLFDYYEADIKKCNPLGRLSLRQFIESTKSPRKKILDTFDKIRDASARGNKKLKDELKKELFFFTPCVLMGGWRSYDSIEGFNGILMLDIDNITNAPELRDYLFDTFPEVVCSFCSVSGLGVKAFIRIPLCKSVEEFKSYAYGFFTTAQYFVGFDIATQSPVLSCFISHDKDIKYRENPKVWSKKGGKVNDPDKVEIDPNFEATDELSEDGIRMMAKHLKNIIGRAEIEQSGHKFTVSAGSLMGGWCAFYSNLDPDKMLDYLDGLIDESSYLSSKSSTYKKTVRDMFKKGSMKPLEYKPRIKS